MGIQFNNSNAQINGAHRNQVGANAQSSPVQPPIVTQPTISGGLNGVGSTSGGINQSTPSNPTPTATPASVVNKMNDMIMHGANVANHIPMRNNNADTNYSFGGSFIYGSTSASQTGNISNHNITQAVNAGVVRRIGDNTDFFGSAALTANGAVSGKVGITQHLSDTSSVSVYGTGGRVSGNKWLNEQDVKNEVGVGIQYNHQITDALSVHAGVERLHQRTASGLSSNVTRASIGATYAEQGSRWETSVNAGRTFSQDNHHGSNTAGLTIRWTDKPRDNTPLPRPERNIASIPPGAPVTILQGGRQPVPLMTQPEPEAKPQNTVGLQSDAYFNHNSAQLRTPVSGNALNELSRMLNDPKAMVGGGTLYHALNNDGQKLTVVGHTDFTGSDSYNQRLSENRARAVAQHLIEEAKQNGTTVNVANLIKTQGNGEQNVRHREQDMAGRGLSREELHAAISSDRRVDVVSKPFSQAIADKIDIEYLRKNYSPELLNLVVSENQLTNTQRNNNTTGLNVSALNNLVNQNTEATKNNNQNVALPPGLEQNEPTNQARTMSMR